MELEGIKMRESLDAVFENGSFRPVKPVTIPLSQGQHVRITVETSLESQDDLIELAAQVYAGLSDEQVHEIEQIALDRSNFFNDSTTR